MINFQVTYIVAEDYLVSNKTNLNTISVGNLRPHRNYTFTIVSLSGILQSTPISKIFTTNESIPGKVGSS